MAVKDKPKRTRKPRAKQGYLPDMEPPSVKAIDDAAENYYDTMLERKSLGELEGQQKDALIGLMKEHGMSRYTLPDGKVVEVTATSNVKVKKPKEKEEMSP